MNSAKKKNTNSKTTEIMGEKRGIPQRGLMQTQRNKYQKTQRETQGFLPRV